ncbi:MULTISPECIES: serine/threonine-protein kinase [Actinomadura]|uniref:Serine/threonine protein kinase n=1 Tax=Actinomadura madurae TaxID=1993 RepID=A0A1I4W1V9_9ACTN|nr:serine/threonine-protein kinase [Actinomadura madurae]SFN07564.1 Serine/threonine protein kinase [Actinomadura madurae]SPT64360.1 Serine/threonine-protein kinase AfsK [Actinomadura madurae]
MTSPGPLVPGDPARLGRYELVGRLGEGGQSVVYLGRREDGVRAAVKLLRDQLSRSPEWRARFEREMRMIGRVAGFCTAQVVDADISGDLPYVVSEYVPGPSLSGLVNEQGPRIGTDLDRLAIGTVTALAAIHRAGILHRDFKPSNVLMGPDGPRVIDFGIARVIGAASARGSGVVGTPSYMAPEQVTDAELGSGVDMFTWAATMLFAATGRHPFGNDTISAVFHRILNYEPDLSPLPESLRGVVASCLAKDPAMRPAAQEVLLTLLGGHDVPEDEGALSTGAHFAGDARVPPTVGRPAQPAGTDSGGTYQAPQPHTVPPRRRRRGLGIAAAVVAPLVALAAGGTAWLLMSDGSGENPAKADTGSVAPPAAAAEAVAPAAQAITSVLSFDHAEFEENVAAAHRVSTPRYGADYDRQLGTRDYKEELASKKGSVSTEVVDSAVVSARSGQVTVLSYVKRTVRAENADPTRLQDPMRATMVKQGGGWLLDSLYSLKAGSPKADVSGATWPGTDARGVIDTVSREPSVARGTALEVGLRSGEAGTGLTALVLVGDCESTCTDNDKIEMRRLLLQPAGGGWKVAKSEAL